MAAKNPFSMRGRMGRKQYWQIMATLMGVRIVAAVLPEFLPDIGTRALDFIFVFMAIIMGRRLHDFGRSAIWAWLAVLIFAVVLPVTELLYFGFGTPEDPLDNISGLAILNLLALVAVIVAIGSVNGDSGPNKFGKPEDGTPVDVLAGRG